VPGDFIPEGIYQQYQDANWKLNLRVGFGSETGTWTVELWGNNVTDEQTRNVTFNTPLRTGSRGTFLEAPRTYGVTLRTAF
jgi:outer membrane receptor protein involved in Fe transport